MLVGTICDDESAINKARVCGAQTSTLCEIMALRICGTCGEYANWDIILQTPEVVVFDETARLSFTMALWGSCRDPKNVTLVFNQHMHASIQTSYNI
jgi:hypothetical protein